MSTVTASSGSHTEIDPGHPPTSTGLSNEKVGMWSFLGSECLLFGALISTYLLFKGQSLPGTIQPVDVFDIPYTSVSSFVLLMSSLTMVLALAAIQRGDHRLTRIWLLTTALLGALTIFGSLYAWALEPATAPEDTPVHGPDTSGEDLEAVPA